MSEIGFLSPSQEGPENVLTGSIRTLQLALDITLRPTGEPANSTRPSHRIMTKTEIGQFVEVGSAWTKEMTRPDKFGETFLSLTIDDPSFAHALNVSAFKSPDSDKYRITWRRRQERQQSPAAT